MFPGVDDTFGCATEGLVSFIGFKRRSEADLSTDNDEVRLAVKTRLCVFASSCQSCRSPVNGQTVRTEQSKRPIYWFYPSIPFSPNDSGTQTVFRKNRAKQSCSFSQQFSRRVVVLYQTPGFNIEVLEGHHFELYDLYQRSMGIEPFPFLIELKRG